MTIVQDSSTMSLASLRAAIAGCFRHLRLTRPSVVIGFLAHGAMFARVIGTLARVPRIVISLRSTHSRRPWHDWLLRLTRGLGGSVVTNSRVAAEAQQRAGVVKASRSVVIANGFDPDRVLAPRQECPPQAGAFTWLSIAGFRPEKGHATLLEAFAQIADGCGARLWLAGDGPELPAMQALAASLGLGDKVSFLGNRDDVGSLIHAADGFVLPSYQEGLPNALIEALVGGLPAVSTDVGSCRELIEPSGAGILVPAGDAPALANAMARIMDLPFSARAEAARRARRDILDRYSIDTMVARWCAVIDGEQAKSRPQAPRQPEGPKVLDIR